MRILFFINVLSAGGKERRLTELMKVLKIRQECEFELAVMNDKIHYKEILDLNIRVHYLIRETKKDLSVFTMFFKLCKDYRPDIVHCWDTMTAIYSVPVCKLLKIKLVNGLITNAPEKRNIFNEQWMRAKLSFPFSDVIVGNSKAGLNAYKAPKRKSIYIHNGFNFERTSKIYEAKAIRDQLKINTPYIVGMVANNSQNKDYKTYFEAAKIVLAQRKDITFLAIGENTNSALAFKMIGTEYHSFFRLLGRETGIESYINAMDICVLSTFTEGISNSILEYMALGKPVIATSGGGTNEIVIDKKTGFLINKSSPEELAGKIEILLNDKPLLSKMGGEGLYRIKSFFTIENMVAAYITLYKDVLTKPREIGMFIMKKFLREILAFILIQVYYLRKHDHEGIISIYFHNPSKALFEKILKWFLNKGYTFISVKELESIIYKQLNHNKCVFISFDDGWKGNLDLIESIEKFKVPVTLFIVTEPVVEGNYWWEYILIDGQQKYSGIANLEDFKRLEENAFNEKIDTLKHKYQLNRSCINLEDLKKLGENNYITIGSHTVTHPIMTTISYETQMRELLVSKETLSQWLNQDIVYLSYPNGNYNDDTIRIAMENGYRLCFTTNIGKIDVKNVNPYIIPRNSLYDNGGYFENISKIIGIWQKYIPSNNMNSEPEV